MKDAMLHHVRARNSFKAHVDRSTPERVSVTKAIHRRAARRGLKQQIRMEIDDINDQILQQEVEDAKFYEMLASDEDVEEMAAYDRRQDRIDELMECIMMDQEMADLRMFEEKYEY